MNRCLKPLAFGALVLVSFYVFGFLLFASQAFLLPSLSPELVKNEKNLILFTGQPERIYALRDVIGEGFSGSVFLSGVNPKVSVEDILPNGSGDAFIVMDYDAKSTRENAINTKGWLGPVLGKKPFVFITNRYHMPRSLLLLEKEGLGDLAQPYPVSGAFKPLRWWREYHKWLWVCADSYVHLSEKIGKIGLNHAS